MWLGSEWGFQAREPITAEERKALNASNVNAYAYLLRSISLPLNKVQHNDCWYCRNYAKAAVTATQPLLPVDFTDERNVLADPDLPPHGGNYFEEANSTQHLLDHIEHDALPVALMKEALRFCNASAEVTQLVLGRKPRGQQLDLLEQNTDEETLRRAAQRHLKKFLRNRLGL
jgi:hypothetical protein